MQSSSSFDAVGGMSCPFCKQPVVTEDGGLVVAFGQSFFHVDCFRCAKCGNRVTADTNLLLLSDGSPICEQCTYSCNVCHQPILDEAFMTGEDSYHADCFKCKVCHKKIDGDLTFARTSQGIYCMDCHNDRMIKIRRHAERKAERERMAAGGSGSSRSRENGAQQYHRDAGRSSPATPYSADRPSSSRSNSLNFREDRSPGSSRGTRSPQQTTHPYVDDAFEPSSYPSPNLHSASSSKPNLPSASPSSVSTSLQSHSISVTVAPVPAADTEHLHLKPPRRISLLNQGFTLTEEPPSSPTLQDGPLSAPSAFPDGRTGTRRKSFDDGVRPLDILFKRSDTPAGSISSEADKQQVLTAPISRRDKRRSINPSFVLGDLSVDAGPQSSSPLLSPVSMTFGGQQTSTRSQSGTLGPSAAHYQDTGQHSAPLQYSDAGPSDNFSDKRPGRPKRMSTSSLNVRDARHSHPTGGSRPNSPAHTADVPHNIESGTDTDTEDFESDPTSPDFPPAPPPKEDKLAFTAGLSNGGTPSFDPDVSQASQQDSGSDDMSESSPVQSTSRATFIAPALPPIRFSLPADFSDLLTAVGSQPISKQLDVMATLSEMQCDDLLHSPLPSANSILSNATSTSDATVVLRDSGARSGNEFPEELSNASSDGNADAKAIAQPILADPPLYLSEVRESVMAPVDTSQIDPTIGPPAIRPGRTVSPQNPQANLTNGSVNGATNTRSLSSQQETFPSSRQPATSADLILRRLREVLVDAEGRGAQHSKLDRPFIEAIISTLEAKQAECLEIRSKLDGSKRESRQYIDAAHTELERETKAKRDAEAEVARLRVLLSSQVARYTALNGDTRRRALRQKMTEELSENLSGLEQDLSKLKVERDMALAEVEELSLSKTMSKDVAGTPPATLGRSLTKRLDNIKSQYQSELIPLNQQREALVREVTELKAIRDVFLEETTVLNARNEELTQLNNEYSRRMESLPQPPVLTNGTRGDVDRPSDTTVIPTDENSEAKAQGKALKQEDAPTPQSKKPKWPGFKAKDIATALGKGKPRSVHTFQQLSILRFSKCDHCGDKLWGSQLKCYGCNLCVHVRCGNLVNASCSQRSPAPREEPPLPEHLPPSLFGRELIEQVRADAKGGNRAVPVIVEKCIAAVEATALDYEGIYRKTGGQSHTNFIIQLFERGDYDSFDLLDSERFYDINSVTSVLKKYFRMLPVPLFTYDLHDSFMSAIQIRDPALKNEALLNVVNKLPNEHYFTLRQLMLHLHHVCQQSEVNLMNARNLGVVLGPTLTRSPDPSAEFSEMAGKALLVEWLVENAPSIFIRSDSL